jgi:hypothetical protein
MAVTQDHRTAADPALPGLVHELAQMCLEGTALANALLALQGEADEREADASAALAEAAERPWDAQASYVAFLTLAELGRVNRDELAASARWAVHAAHTRELAEAVLHLEADELG